MPYLGLSSSNTHLNSGTLSLRSAARNPEHHSTRTPPEVPPRELLHPDVHQGLLTSASHWDQVSQPIPRRHSRLAHCGSPGPRELRALERLGQRMVLGA